MKKVSGINYIILAILAFASLGLEILLAFGVEPIIYGAPINKWTDLQNIIHWVITCILWGTASWYITLYAKKKINSTIHRLTIHYKFIGHWKSLNNGYFLSQLSNG